MCVAGVCSFVHPAFGEAKPAKTYKVLLVDEDNACLGPMAEAIGRKNFSESVLYSSGGRTAAEQFDPAMVADKKVAGVTAGASTPEDIISDFVQKLEAI